MLHDLKLIAGSKGGGKGKGGGSDANDSLRSKARARVVEMLSEGPIHGLVNGAQSIYFDQTPVKNADGTENFKNVIWRENKGYPTDQAFNGNPTVETPFSVGVEVKKNTGPVTRTVNEANADALRIIMRLPALVHQDEEDGSLKPASVSYAIEVRPYGGSFQRVHTENIVNQKTTSAYQKAHRIDLPAGGAPWDVRVVRLTDDSEDVKLNNETWWDSYVALVEGKFIYPMTAATFIEVNAEDMGESIPPRSFHIRGLIVQVPSNYDPIARTYTGLWDGTFKNAWTNNPAWVFYDLITNDRYGLGEFVNSAKVDKWSLYQIAQHCDQMIKSGFKDPDGNDIMEPRFTFNGVINTREEAHTVLQQIATTWRGMAFWSLGQVFATADMPEDPSKLVTPANVIDGDFTYQGTSLKARHSVAVVTWNDPDDFYRPAVELVINDEMLQRYGWREKAVQLTGCTSRGLAHRYGKWILDTEQHETETVEYEASWDHSDIRPGNIIAIADPTKAEVRFGGRIAQIFSNHAIIDQPFKPEGTGYTMVMTLPDGNLIERPVSSFGNQQPDGSYTRINWAAAIGELPLVNSMWVLTGSDIAPRTFRVLSVKETEKNRVQVTALFHDPTKYARVEENLVLEAPAYRRPSKLIAPPTNLSIQETHYMSQGTPRSKLNISWTNSPDFLTKEYRISATSPRRGRFEIGTTRSTFIELNDVEPGEYEIEVVAVGFSSSVSAPLIGQYEVVGWSLAALPTVSNLELADRPGQTTFTGKDIRVRWKNNFAISSDPTSTDGAPAANSAFYRFNTVRVYDVATNSLLRTEQVTTNAFTYSYQMNVRDNQLAGRGPARHVRFEVTVTDSFNRTSSPATLAVLNTPPAAFNPTAYVNGNTIYLYWKLPADEDVAGSLIWVKDQTGFTPLVAEATYDGPNTSLTLPVAPNKIYYIRAAAYDAFGKDGLNISPELEVTVSDFSLDNTPPAIPTGLVLTSQIINGEARLIATWNANTEDDIGAYDAEIKQPGGNFVGFPTNTNRYEWPVTAGGTYTVRLRARDQIGNASQFSAEVTHVVATDSVPPATPVGFTVQGGFETYWLKWDRIADKDLSHYEIYVSSAITAPVWGSVATYTSTAESFIITGQPENQSRYFWVRAIDTSGNKSGWSLRIQATTSSMAAPLPAGVPGAPTLSSTVSVDAQGNVRARIRVTWSATTNATAYSVGVKVGAGNEAYMQTSGLAVEFDGLPGVAYEVRVAALNSANAMSTYSSVSILTPAGDTTAPAVPTGLTAQAGFGTFLLKWTAVTANDLSHYEVFQSSSSTTPAVGAAATYQVAATTLSITGEPENATRHFWIRAVDTSGNKSAWSSRAQATTTINSASVTTAQLVGLVDATSFASGLSGVAVAEGLPEPPFTASTPKVIYVGGVLYRQRADGSDWTAETDATLITGKIVSGQIETGAVKADQVDVNAINARHLSIADTTILADNANFQNGGAAVGWGIGNVHIQNIPAEAYPGQTWVWKYAGLGSVATRNAMIIPVMPGEKFYASCHVKTNGNAGVNTKGVRISWCSDAAGNAEVSTTIAAFTTANPTAWTFVDGFVTVPANSTIRFARLEPHAYDNVSGGIVWIANPRMMRAAATLIEPQGITAEKVTTGELITLSAQIKTAIINDAHIQNLSAAKLTAGSAIANTITVSGTSLANIQSWANNPASRINSASTLIDPGKITISGGTTLANWRGTSDTTKINGGQIQTDSIQANAIAANTITAKQLLITDLGNMAPNGDWSSAWEDQWIASSGSTNHFQTDPVYTKTGSRSFVLQKSTVTSSINVVGRDYIPITGNTDYYFETEARTGGVNVSAGFYFRVNWYDGNKAAISPNYVDVAGNTALSTAWTVFSGIHRSPANARFCRIQFYNHSTNTTEPSFVIDRVVMKPAIGASITADGTIRANHLFTGELITVSAQIKNAIINDAHIANLSAAKLTAGTAIANSITVNGNTLNNIETWAENPAARVNAASTTINPGKILISGSTTLANWQRGGDTTKIDGGAISANTISANKLEIGSRNVSYEGLELEHNKPATNQISWTSSIITYVNDAGSTVRVTIAAGSATWSSGTLFIYWAKDATTFTATTSSTTAFGINNVLICTYKGGTNIVADYGRTIIDGSDIKTGTITTNQLAANTIKAGNIESNAIQARHLLANQITTDKLAVGLGKNQLFNPSFSFGTDGWYATPTSQVAYLGPRPAGSSWAHATQSVLEVYQPNGTTTGYTDVRQVRPDYSGNGGRYGVPCAPGQIWECSAYLSTHRCSAELRMEVRNAAGTVIAYVGYTSQGEITGSSTHPDQWNRLVVRGVMPANAATVEFHLRKLPTYSGQSNSYLFLNKPLLAEVQDGATEAMPWTDGSVTMVTQNGIVTDGIVARHITTDAIEARHIKASQVTADKISVTSLSAISATLGNVNISNANIGTLTVGTSNIQPGAVTEAGFATRSSAIGLTGTWTTCLSFAIPRSTSGFFNLVGNLQGSGFSGTIRVIRRDNQVVKYQGPLPNANIDIFRIEENAVPNPTFWDVQVIGSGVSQVTGISIIAKSFKA